MLEWHTERRKVSDLVPWDRNPRRMTGRQAKDLKKSLERLNLMSIPVVDLDNRIVSGHMRCKMLVALGRGHEEIDVRVPNRKLTDEEFAEANLRENKNLGEWDEGLLATFDDDMLREVGFGEDELKELFGLETESVPKDEIELKRQCQLIIDFDSEAELQAAFDKFSAEGYICRTLIL